MKKNEQCECFAVKVVDHLLHKKRHSIPILRGIPNPTKSKEIWLEYKHKRLRLWTPSFSWSFGNLLKIPWATSTNLKGIIMNDDSAMISLKIP